MLNYFCTDHAISGTCFRLMRQSVAFVELPEYETLKQKHVLDWQLAVLMCCVCVCVCVCVCIHQILNKANFSVGAILRQNTDQVKPVSFITVFHCHSLSADWTSLSLSFSLSLIQTVLYSAETAILISAEQSECKGENLLFCQYGPFFSSETMFFMFSPCHSLSGILPESTVCVCADWVAIATWQRRYCSICHEVKKKTTKKKLLLL